MRKLIAVAILSLTFAALVCGLNHPVPVRAQQMFQSLNYPTGLVGWWKLCGDTSATSGCNPSSSTTAYDSSGYGYNATWVGTCSGSSPYCYSTTTEVGAYSGSFDGSTNYVYTTSVNSKTPTGNSPWSLIAWVNCGSSCASYGYIFGTSTSLTLYLNPTNLECGPFQSTLSLTVNAWHFVGCTWNGSTMTIYVDGSSQSSAESALSLTTTWIYIGAKSNGQDKWKSNIQDARLYSRALGAGEMAQMYLAHN
ncbi:MAG: LamG domain-containing protein [Terracidiphilus sp.]|jgi:hypothetical protein